MPAPMSLVPMRRALGGTRLARQLVAHETLACRGRVRGVNRVAIPLVPSAGLSAATTATAALGAAGVLGASFTGAPTCLFAAATGVPCPFCGLTHGVAQLGAGDVEAALALHPLSPLAAVLALVVPFALLRRRSLANAHPRRSLLVAPAALAGVTGIVLMTWIVRLAG